MDKFNFSNVTINANKVIINSDVLLNWNFHNVVINERTTERHYKCKNTGAWKCKEYKKGGGLKSTTYSFPESEDYNIKTEEELIKQLRQ